jgi:hypothetical protein
LGLESFLTTLLSILAPGYPASSRTVASAARSNASGKRWPLVPAVVVAGYARVLPARRLLGFPQSLRLAAVRRVFWELARASRSVFLMRRQLRMTLRWRSWTAASTPGRSGACPWKTPRPISRSTGRPGLRVGVRGA